MFHDDTWWNRQFANSTRYNACCAKVGPVLSLSYQRQTLFDDEDMTNSTGAPQGGAGVGELLQPWRRIATHLCPLIGESGFCALFGRAVHVIGPDHAWLAPPQVCRLPEQLFTTLEERMALVDAERAASANEALLRTFTQLLAALIGNKLTQRLLESARAAGDTSAGQQKHAQEHK